MHSCGNEQVVPELEGTSNTKSPIVRAAAIKFILIFRSLIDKSSLLDLLPGICSLLEAKDYLVHSYAAFLIERLLALKTIPQGGGDSGSYRISMEEFQSKVCTINTWHIAASFAWLSFCLRLSLFFLLLLTVIIFNY